MRKPDPIRNVFVDPDIGDVIRVYGETHEVIAIERHPGKTIVRVRIEGQLNRLRNVSLESWSAYCEDAEVVVNQSKVSAFDPVE